MANKNTQEVWVGPGVLSLGRRTKIMPGDPVPAELGKEARESLRAKGKITDEVVDEVAVVDVEALIAKADAARAESEEAMTALGELSNAVKDAGKAVATAKTTNTKAEKAAAADGATDAVKASAVKASEALAAAETDHTVAKDMKTAASEDAAKLAETAARLRVDADVAVNG